MERRMPLRISSHQCRTSHALFESVDLLQRGVLPSMKDTHIDNIPHHSSLMVTRALQQVQRESFPVGRPVKCLVGKPI